VILEKLILTFYVSFVIVAPLLYIVSFCCMPPNGMPNNNSWFGGNREIPQGEDTGEDNFSDLVKQQLKNIYADLGMEPPTEESSPEDQDTPSSNTQNGTGQNG
jgi:hypothetical protein